MKNIMKLSLVIMSCISVTGYSAEKPLNPDAIIREAHATGEPIPQSTIDKIMQQQATFLKKQDMDFRKTVVQSYIDAKQPVPARIILTLEDAQIAALATRHNQNLQEQLQVHQPK